MHFLMCWVVSFFMSSDLFYILSSFIFMRLHYIIIILCSLLLSLFSYLGSDFFGTFYRQLCNFVMDFGFCKLDKGPVKDNNNFYINSYMFFLLFSFLGFFFSLFFWCIVKGHFFWDQVQNLFLLRDN